MKKFFFFLLLISSFPSYSQNTLEFVYDLDRNYPDNMPRVKKWVDSTLDPLFILGLQSSDSYRGEHKFITFSLMGRNPININLPYSHGLQLQFSTAKVGQRIKSQQIKIDSKHEIKAYGVRFDPNKWTYGLKDYFYAASDILRLSADQLVAHTLNRMVEPKPETRDKVEQLVRDLNAKLKINLPYPKGDNKFQELLATMKKELPGIKTYDAIYDTYILVEKDKAKSEQNLNNFFAVTGFFPETVIRKVDDMITPKIDIGFDKAEVLIIPSSILSPVKGIAAASDTIKFQYKLMQSRLDYKNQKLEITFTGKLNQKATLHKGQLYDYGVKGKKFALVKPDKKRTESVDFREMKLIVSETGVSLEGTTNDEDIFLIFNNSWENKTKGRK